VARFSAASTFACVFKVSRLPLQARATILCVISTGETATRSCGLRLCARMIWAIGCSPKLRSISGFIGLKPVRVIQGEAPSWVRESALDWVGHHLPELLSAGKVGLKLVTLTCRQVAGQSAFADRNVGGVSALVEACGIGSFDSPDALGYSDIAVAWFDGPATEDHAGLWKVLVRSPIE